MTQPIIFQWDGEVMKPLTRFHNICNAEFTIGEMYRMETIEERSIVSHRHYFAALHSLWLNMPERASHQFPSEEHLRKHCLIMTGFRDERSFVASSKAEALRLAAFIRPVDEYAVVSVHEATVLVWTAQSQSMKAMGKKRFQDSKQAVLDFAADLVGVTVEASQQNVAA
jgi:hypothetical protein